MEKIRLGIIGIGNMGSEHCRLILSGQTPEIALTCVADPRQDRRDWAQQTLPAGTGIYADGMSLIRAHACDAVLIATPHELHPPLAEAALRAGLHVLSEKPAGVYTAQLHPVIAAAQETGRTYALMFNQRTNCVYRRLKALLDSGELGALKRVTWVVTDWYRSQAYYDSGSWRATWTGEGGGVLFNQCPHQLDLISWVTGMMPTAVRSFCNFGRFHDIEVEDDVTAYLEYANGANGVFITTTGEFPGTNRFEVAGTKGKLVCENDKLMMTKVTPDTREFTKTAKSAFVLPEKETFEVETDGVNLQHMGICRNFTNAILGKEPLFVDGKEGINGVELMDAMLLSTWLDKKVAIPIDDELYYNELKKRIAVSRRKENVIDTVADTEDTYGSKVKR